MHSGGGCCFFYLLNRRSQTPFYSFVRNHRFPLAIYTEPLIVIPWPAWPQESCSASNQHHSFLASAHPSHRSQPGSCLLLLAPERRDEVQGCPQRDTTGSPPSRAQCHHWCPPQTLFYIKPRILSVCEVFPPVGKF